MSKFFWLSGLIIILILSFLTLHFYQKNKTKQMNKSLLQTSSAIAYIPIGDSYTIGLGVREEERWSNLLVRHLREDKIEMEILTNPSVSGYTVKDALSEEVLEVEQLKPKFVTVFIGANDSFSNGSPITYQRDLKSLLDKIQEVVNKNLVLITLPDYTKAPAAQQFSAFQRDQASENVKQYNEIIKEEAKDRGLEVADIYPISLTMIDSSDYISDGLHPSAQGYQKWESIIYPVILKKLKQDE